MGRERVWSKAAGGRVISRCCGAECISCPVYVNDELFALVNACHNMKRGGGHFGPCMKVHSVIGNGIFDKDRKAIEKYAGQGFFRLTRDIAGNLVGPDAPALPAKKPIASSFLEKSLESQDAEKEDGPEEEIPF